MINRFVARHIYSIYSFALFAASTWAWLNWQPQWPYTVVAAIYLVGFIALIQLMRERQDRPRSPARSMALTKPVSMAPAITPPPIRDEQHEVTTELQPVAATVQPAVVDYKVGAIDCYSLREPADR